MLAQPIKDIRLLQPVPNVNQATCSQTTTQYPSTTPGPNHAGQASSQDPQNNRGWQGSLKAIWFNPPALAVAAMAGCPGARQNSIWRSPRWRDSTICLENSNNHPHSKEVFPWCSKGIFCVSICTHHLLPRLQASTRAELHLPDTLPSGITKKFILGSWVNYHILQGSFFFVHGHCLDFSNTLPYGKHQVSPLCLRSCTEQSTAKSLLNQIFLQFRPFWEEPLQPRINKNKQHLPR